MASSSSEPPKGATIEGVKNGKPIQIPAAYDFRSDTVTTPTPSMLQSIMSIHTHGDDVFSEDTTTNNLESFIVELTGKPASCFVMSGTMGNQVSIRSHLAQPPHSIVLDSRSHINNYEAGGAAVLSQAHVIPVTPTNGNYLTLEEIEASVVDSDDIHYAPTRLICLENSLKGAIMPVEEIQKISKFAREKGIKLHLDGARLWNVVAAGGGDLKEIVSYFDSVSLCFSKGLGAPMGSIIIGEKDFMKRVRHFRKMVGGATRQIGIATGPARTAVEEIFLGGKLARTHELAKRLEASWAKLGGTLRVPCDTNMVWLDLGSVGGDETDIPKLAKNAGLKWDWERIVVHHQISDDAIERLEGVFEKLVENAKVRGGVPSNKKGPSGYARRDAKRDEND
ncbi:hypothetical protein H072_4765 [Dactylellina haptotyla CBS 200.50]|uniref:Aromatic amino acid beta-eliminating lyase/threonine aldolase domain-containing protein n=1 Tax=Dactylellina haptotyla (strain CBS 200.50) TaxID=1284197 RepID=S8BPI2_DACHA|nr:hypothetical protein H072_4765 [Dactylellina haptotyla CBS 200.50]